MADKIKELLAVLDMGRTILSTSSGKPVIDIFDRERKQIEWLCANDIIKHKKYPSTFMGDRASNKLTESLADLAFRLRDEVVERNYSLYADKAMEMIAMRSAKALSGYNKPSFDEWAAYEAQPIHWIIAALIAKELTE